MKHIEEWFLWQQLATEDKWHLSDNGGWYIERYDIAAKRATWTAMVANFSAVKALVEDIKRRKGKGTCAGATYRN